MISKWVNTNQMLADFLTKEDQRAGDYLRIVLKSGRYELTEDTMADHRRNMTERPSLGLLPPKASSQQAPFRTGVLA